MKPRVIIGFQLPTDNVYAVGGYCAAEMAFDNANRTVGEGELPVHIELIPIIDGRDPAVAIPAARDFTALDNVIAVLGPTNSAMAVITQEIYHEAGLLQLSSEASSPLLTSRGFENFYRTVANDEHQGRALAQVAVKYLEAERIAVINEDSAWGEPIARIFAKEATALGRPPVLHFGFGERENDLDFDAVIEATLDAKPDLVYFAVYWNKTHILTHRLRDRGLDAVFLGSDALKPYEFLEVPSLDTRKPYHSLAGIDPRVAPSAKSFLLELADKFPLMLGAPQYAAEAYDCANLIVECIRRAETTDRSGVLAAMKTIKQFDGAIGTIAFDEHGDLIQPEIGLFQSSDGQRNYIGSIADLVSAKAQN
ncbi:MAG: branched-chain amino acid ABC transporter substrate-binding protein [Rhodothermales bacterium]|nr:branched-chain amino acid ABC transporter substrate-binding protein [Rhodothermales bacterium]